VKVIQAYRFALDPSPAQERALHSHAHLIGIDLIVEARDPF